MHGKKIMNRDLKPENILFKNNCIFQSFNLSENHDIAITDFGLATYSDVDYLFVRCGTPGFVAPEVLNIRNLKAKYDHICDVFSAGVIFYLLFVFFE
jgi:serine/threonine protein kinase